MAVSVGPYQNLDISGALQWGSLVPDLNARALAEREMANREGTLGMQRGQEARLLAKQQAEAAALADQQRQAEEVIRDPSPTNLFNYSLRNPDVANEAKATWELKDEATRRAEFEEMSNAYTMALRDPKKAAAYMRQRSTAGDEKDDEDEAIADLLDSGDREQIRQAYAQMGLHTMIASGDPEKFEQTFRKYYVPEYDDIAGGDYIVEKNWGDVGLNAYGKVESGPAGFYPYKQPGGIPIFGGGTTQTFGGGDTSTNLGTGITGGTNQGARTHTAGIRRGGWTPRQRDGGDNTDEAVDGKLTLLQQRTGLSPDQPLTGKDLGKVYDAIVASEGTTSIGARNNNGGNIKDGKWAKAQPGYAGSEGGFAKFKTPEAGRAAGMKLLGQKFLKGHKTIRDMVEGKVDEAKVRADARRAIAAGAPQQAVAAEAAKYGVKI